MKYEMKKVLPIQEKPSIITCIHYAYPCAIIESKELAIFEIKDFEQTMWNQQTGDTEIKIDGNRITILKKGLGEDTNSVLWRKCREKDEIIMKIEYVKLMDIARYIDIFLFGDDLAEEIVKEDKTCGVRWNPYGYFMKKHMYSFDTKHYVFVKVCKEDIHISCYASDDGLKWEFLDRKEMKDSSKLMNFGLHIYNGKDQYDKWKKMNFIQLLYNEDNPFKGIWLDYYVFPRKNVDNSYMYFPNFLDTYYDTTYEAIDCFKTLDEYIKWNITHYYYVELCLDEFYVEERGTYQKIHYPHYNLFYGFDDQLRVYYIMGYGCSNTPVIGQISYDTFNNKLILSEKIIRYRYHGSEIKTLEFNIKSIKLGLYEFIHDIKSDEKMCNMLTGEKVSYGISILKELATTEKGRKHLLQDRRISFCLKEHCVMMGERLEYLYENEFLMIEHYLQLKQIYTQMYRSATILLNLVIKNSFKPNKECEIYDTLLELYENEKVFCKNLLKYIIDPNFSHK